MPIKAVEQLLEHSPNWLKRSELALIPGLERPSFFPAFVSERYPWKRDCKIKSGLFEGKR